MEKALISEIFCSIQGEGKNVGYPSIFIRFWGCNLRCTFNGITCDTPYAVVKEKDKAINYTVDDLITKIENFNCNHIVFTGGEPGLWQKFINELLGKIKGYTFEMETNGSIPILKNLQLIINQFNVSVKLKSSNQETPYKNKCINHKALKTFPKNKSIFKFVYTGKKDLQEINELVTQYKLETYLMPEGVTKKDVEKNSKEVINVCLEKNYKFSPRLHITLWGSKRGK